MTYCGEETEILPQGRVRVERWVDARGELIGELDFYRHRQELHIRGVFDEDFDARAAIQAFDTELDRQRAQYEQRDRIARSARRRRTNGSGPVWIVWARDLTTGRQLPLSPTRFGVR